MPVEKICFFSTLIRYAYELGQARLSKDPERILEAQIRHDNYKILCLSSDKMIVDINIHQK